MLEVLYIYMILISTQSEKISEYFLWNPRWDIKFMEPFLLFLKLNQSLQASLFWPLSLQRAVVTII